MARPRRNRANRVDPFRDPKGVSDAAIGFILDAEESITDRGAGHDKLDLAATALAAFIDIPILPEAIEVLIARVIIQVLFGTIDDIAKAVRSRKRRRKRD